MYRRETYTALLERDWGTGNRETREKKTALPSAFFFRYAVLAYNVECQKSIRLR